MISVQLGISVGEAFIRLRARAFAADRPLSELAIDVVARRIRFDNEGRWMSALTGSTLGSTPPGGYRPFHRRWN